MRTVALWQSDVGNPADVRDRCVDVGLGLLCLSFVSEGDLLSENSEPPGGLVRSDEVYGQVSDVAELARRRFLGLVM